MNVCSVYFLTFTAICFVIYWILPMQYRKYSLFAFGIGFWILCAEWYTMLALIFAVFVCWGMSRILQCVQNQIARKACLIVSIILLIGQMLFFRFYRFDSDSLARPIAISFWTLSLITYLVDAYREKLHDSVFDLLLFSSYFPLLTIGPICRYSILKGELHKQRRFDYSVAVRGTKRIAYGIIKKRAIADILAPMVSLIFDDYKQYSGICVWIGVVVYGIQLYFDFSGGIDIIIGTSNLFGIDLQENFKRPYLALSIGEFWHRWHISFSTWLRDYVYIPLGGNRKGKGRQIINLFATFIISGFWHGNGMNYCVWGVLHGFYQTMDIMFRKHPKDRKNSKLCKSFWWILTMMEVMFA